MATRGNFSYLQFELLIYALANLHCFSTSQKPSQNLRSPWLWHTPKTVSPHRSKGHSAAAMAAGFPEVPGKWCQGLKAQHCFPHWSPQWWRDAECGPRQNPQPSGPSDLAAGEQHQGNQRQRGELLLVAELWALTWALLSSEARSWQEGATQEVRLQLPLGILTALLKQHWQVHDPGVFSSCESCTFLRFIPRYSLVVLVFVNWILSRWLFIYW